MTSPHSRPKVWSNSILKILSRFFHIAANSLEENKDVDPEVIEISEALASDETHRKVFSSSVIADLQASVLMLKMQAQIEKNKQEAKHRKKQLWSGRGKQKHNKRALLHPPPLLKLNFNHSALFCVWRSPTPDLHFLHKNYRYGCSAYCRDMPHMKVCHYLWELLNAFVT